MSTPAARQGRELAVLLSVTTRIEPELMRAVRITVAPLLDVSAETDLWFGDLVERRGFGYVSLRGDLLPHLRAQLTDRLTRAPAEAPVHRLWSVIERLHAGRSPALFAEEHATWLAVRDGAQAAADIDRVLRPALRALVEQGRDGVARWFAGAWQRLPDPVRRTTTAWQLATVTSARLAGVALRPEAPERLAVTDIGLIAGRLPRAPLRVRRDGPDLRIGEHLDGGVTIEVPDTDPRVLDLLDDPLPRTLLVPRGSTATQHVGWGPVRLLAADGAVYDLPAPSLGPAPGPRRRGTAGTGRRIAVGHTGACQAWGTWVRDQADSAGFETAARPWNPDPGTPLGDALAELGRDAHRTLLVLGATDRRPGGRTDTEWHTALTEAAAERPGRLALVLVGDTELPDPTVPGPTVADLPVADLPVADLRGLTEQDARRALFALLGTPLADRGDRPAPGTAPRFPGTAPAVFSAPRRNPRFTGRDDLLNDIRATLLAPGPDTPDHHRCALLGPSGIGKTQTAVEYVHRYGSEYDVVRWINAGFQSTAREQLAELAPRLEVTAGQGIGNRIRAVQAALRSGRPYHRWLLVFDNADDVTEIEDLLPEGAGHILITSGNRTWSDNDRLHRLRVPPFSRAESVAYVLGRAPRVTRDEAELLADAVQDLPLLLSQTAAWLDANPMPVADYLDLVHDTRPGHLDETGDTRPHTYPRALESSWSITLASLGQRSPLALELLKLLTCFTPDAVPVRLLTRHGDRLPPRLAALAAESEAWNAALRDLAETSALRLVPGEDGTERAEVHRPYHALLRDALDEEERDTYSRAACAVLAAADPGEPLDAGTSSRYAELLPHLRISGALDSTDEDVSRLVLNCVEYLRSRGEARTGLRLCELAIARWHHRMPPDSSTMLILTHQHANMLRRMGRYREAEAVGRTVVDRLAATRPPGDPDLLRANNGLGGTLMALGSYLEAHELYRQAVRIEAASPKDDGRDNDQARSNLANVLALLGRYEESWQLYSGLVARRRERYGGDDYRTLYNDLRCCWTLRLLGRYTEALERQRANRDAYRRIQGRFTVNSMIAEHNLALCLRRTGRLEQAEARMRDVVDLARQLQGPRHPEALFVAADYASLLRELRDTERAWELAATVARDYAEALGEGHPFSVGTAGNTGLALWETGDPGLALRIAERALRGMTTALGSDHPWTLGCMLNVSGARSLAGDAEGAAAYSRDCVSRAALALGSTHPLTLASKAALAADLLALGQTDSSHRLEQETLRQLAESQGEDSPSTRAVRRRERPSWDFEPQPA